MLDQLDSVPQPARAELESVLLPYARKLTPAQFDGKARKLRARFHPDSITVRRTKCLADRKVMFFPDKDGMATLWLRAAGEDLHGIYTRVTDAAINLQGPDEPRTLSRLRADVAVDLLAQGVTRTGLGAGLTANVNITVPILTLMGKSEEPGELEGYGPIDPEVARRLAGTATSFLRILTHTHTHTHTHPHPHPHPHPHTGIVLDVSAEPFRLASTTPPIPPPASAHRDIRPTRHPRGVRRGRTDPSGPVGLDLGYRGPRPAAVLRAGPVDPRPFGRPVRS